MKLKLAVATLGTAMAMGLGIMSAAADTSVVVNSSTNVDASGSSACGSQATLVQVNGSDVVNRTDSACTP